MNVPAARAPLEPPRASTEPDRLARMLAGLGYPGFSHVRPRATSNPAAFPLAALRLSDLDSRLAEALPWVAWRYWDLDRGWLLERARVADLQNRLGFAVTLAKQLPYAA